MSYIDEELKIDIDEEEEVVVGNKNLEGDLKEPIDDGLIEDDNFLDDESSGLTDTEY